MKADVLDGGSSVDPDVKKQVDDIWREIEPQCLAQNSGVTPSNSNHRKPTSSDWKVVRLFVSSTFADFFNEREVLVKRVFPELREWCEERHLKLIECDLRWGVPKDTPSGQTVSICLEEIDKCINTSDGFPLFIGLLGDRYGWIPSESDISPEVRDKYRWVDRTSITCMEILHGAYRTRNPNAAFFIRNSSVISDIPESHVGSFVDKDLFASYQLKVLKEKLKAALPDQIFYYEPMFKQMSKNASGEEMFVELEWFDNFAKKVLEFFKSSISRLHPKQDCQEIHPLVQEQNMQWLYILDKANSLIGRQKEKEMLLKFLLEGNNERFEKTECSKSHKIRQMSDWDVCDTDQPLCVVEAPGGWGKTTLISSVIKDIVENQTDLKVVYHMVGSTPFSIQVDWLLRQILSALIKNPNEKDKAVIEGGQEEDQKQLLKNALTEFRCNPTEKMIIILDNVSGLSNSTKLCHLSWLPPFFPSNVRVLVTTTKHMPTKSRLYEHPTLKLSLTTMTSDELSDIAVQYLGCFSKKLHPSQLTALMTNTGVDSPLWLTLMVEELRIFGSYAQMDHRIAELPTSLNKFLQQVFDRLIMEDGPYNLVKKVLCVIVCSRYGMPSDKLLQILGDAKLKEPVPLLEWLKVKRQLSPYLRMTGFLDEMITFCHDSVYQAVWDHFLKEKSDIYHWHTVLADYFEWWCDDSRIRVWHLPYHLRKARLWQRMIRFMRKDKFSMIHMGAYPRSDYLKDCRCRMLADPVIPGTSSVMLCLNCGRSPHAFNPAFGWPNKMCCVICGTHCPSNNPVKAHACMKHAQHRGPDIVKCLLCNVNVSTKPKASAGGASPTPAILCHLCSFGNGDRMCAILSCDRP